MRRSLNFVFAFFLGALTALTLLSMGRVFLRERAVLETRESLRRLAAVTVVNYPEQNPPWGERAADFWKGLGRDSAMRDRWGGEFRLVKGQGSRDWQWRSAGPDGAWNTADDLASEVHYPDAASVSGYQFEPDASGPSSDAR